MWFLHDCFFRFLNTPVPREPNQSTPLDRWLKRGKSKHEEVLEPDLEIIDPHVHFWDACDDDKGNITYWTRLQILFGRTTWRIGKRMTRYLFRFWCSLTESGRGRLNTFGWHPRCYNIFDRYMLQEFKRDLEGHKVVQVVAIESGWGPVEIPHEEGEYRNWVREPLVPPLEAKMLQNLNKTWGNLHKFPNGIVAYADLRLGTEVEETLIELKEVCGNLKGIRHPMNFVGPPVCYVDSKRVDGNDMTFDTKFRQGFTLLEKYDLAFDALIYYNNMRHLMALAKAFPKTTIICEHIGLPIRVGPYNRKYGRVMREWKKGLKLLADCPNVYMKISGLGMPCCGFKFDERKEPPGSEEIAKLWAPYIHDVIEHFGPERCMFASNFPHDRVSCSYKVLFNAYKLVCKDMSGAQKRQLFHDTAKKVYRL